MLSSTLLTMFPKSLSLVLGVSSGSWLLSGQFELQVVTGEQQDLSPSLTTTTNAVTPERAAANETKL